MKRYKISEFENLNLQQRGQLVFKTGKYVTKRRDLHYIFALYTIGKEYVEVRYNDLHNEVEEIEKPKDKRLFQYARDVYRDDLAI